MMPTKRELEIELRDLRTRVGEAELGEHIYSKELDENAYTIRRLRDERDELRGQLQEARKRIAELEECDLYLVREAPDGGPYSQPPWTCLPSGKPAPCGWKHPYPCGMLRIDKDRWETVFTCHDLRFREAWRKGQANGKD